MSSPVAASSGRMHRVVRGVSIRSLSFLRVVRLLQRIRGGFLQRGASIRQFCNGKHRAFAVTTPRFAPAVDTPREAAYTLGVRAIRKSDKEFSLSYSIKRAAVLGSGVMGSALAAHLANAGIPTLLLDIVPPDGSGVKGDPASRDYRDAFARAGLERALKGKPAAFFAKARARRVTIGNLDDDLAQLHDCDWILEAVVERLDIKKSLFERIAPHVHDGAIVTSNTSGLSIADLAAAVPEALRPRFLGTHFFNPPRYLHLLELIPHAGTDPAVLSFFREFGDAVLGKGVVIAKDTPDFIANRIGTFSVMSCIRAMLADGYTVEEVDALTGRLLGRPKSATFRTLDLVGLDIMLHASKTVYDRATEDEQRDYFKPPELLEKMLAAKMLGDKTGKGFYQKIKGAKGSEILTLDPATMDYRPRASAKFPSLELAKPIDDQGERKRMIKKGKESPPYRESLA
jgi:3-hydroxyacyl-CoA dehydrogenase